MITSGYKIRMRGLSELGDTIWVHLIVVITAHFILNAAFDYLLIYDELFYNYFSDKLEFERINEMLEGRRELNWITPILFTLLLLIKFSMTSLCLYLGVFLMNYELTFKQIFIIVIKAELVFLLPMIFKLVWFTFYNTHYDLQTLQHFSPLSVFMLVNGVERWLSYPLQLLSLFELAYWVVLAYQLKFVANKSFLKSLFFVAMTYGVGLLLWTIIVMFVMISFS